MKTEFSAVGRSVFFLLISMVIFSASAQARDAIYDFSDWSEALPDPATWANHFKKYARIELGKERRLPNGVAWRLLTDTGTGVSMPRLTWMPDARRMRTANELLDKIHGAEMLLDEAEWRSLQTINEYRRREGTAPLGFEHAIAQSDVRLTYAGNRLVSLLEIGQLQSEGNFWPAIMRGLTLDLERAEIVHVEACSAARIANVPEGPRGEYRFLFQYGDFLKLCDRETYRKFIALVKSTRRRRPGLMPSSSASAPRISTIRTLPKTRNIFCT